MYTSIVLEGSDLIGKSTIARIMEQWFPGRIRDRLPALSSSIGEFDYESRGIDIVRNSPESLFVILYANDVSILEARLKDKMHKTPFKVDEFDKATALYNRVYRNFARAVGVQSNVLVLSIDNKTSYDIAAEIAKHMLRGIVTELPGISLEGESKVYRAIPGTGLALVSLKSSLYSFTHNRYGTVEGTDVIRQNFWSLFGTAINQAFLEYGDPDFYDLPSSYVTEFEVEGVLYTVVRFWDAIAPLEVIWKNYLVGTTKHDLVGVDQYPTREGAPIEYEGKFPMPIIRFDWRNPLPYQDKCIPDDFASFYINTVNAKATAHFVTEVIRKVLGSKGYELVDLCYFMNSRGTQVCGEISPDGMRIKKKGSSYDKVLWRQGKEGVLICEVWSDLYLDLSSVADCRVMS